MDNLTHGNEMEFLLGRVARTLGKGPDNFCALSDPLAFARDRAHFPSGLALQIDLPDQKQESLVEEAIEYERWDGLA